MCWLRDIYDVLAARRVLPIPRRWTGRPDVSIFLSLFCHIPDTVHNACASGFHDTTLMT